MKEFAVKRSKDMTLRLISPFPATYMAWNVFTFQIFPKFHFSQDTLSVAKQEWLEDGRYLNQNKPNFRWTISNGKTGNHWNHAYLPDEEREGFHTSHRNLIYVPHEQSYYLDEIENDVKSNQEDYINKLEYLNFQQKHTLDDLFKTFEGIYDNLQDCDSAIKEGKFFEQLEKICMGKLTLPIGIIKENTIQYLICNEFVGQIRESHISSQKPAIYRPVAFESCDKIAAKIYDSCIPLL